MYMFRARGFIFRETVVTCTGTVQYVCTFIVLVLITAVSLKLNSRPQNMYKFKPLNPELNPICHLLALLEAHHILHVSRVRDKIS